MQGIEFTDRKGRNCHLSKPHGAGGNSYYLTVNNYHAGEIVRVAGGKWVAYPRTDKLPQAYWNALVKWVEETESRENARLPGNAKWMKIVMVAISA